MDRVLLPMDSVLVANRGEIALRVMRSASRMGLRTVAVFSDPDSEALHVRTADAAVHLAGSDPRQSYRDINGIIEACRRAGVQAVHPGYGFLSENPAFAQAVTDAGLIFVGPSAKAMALMGNKAAAKRAMAKAGVPVTPGRQGCVSEGDFVAAASHVGYPVLLKAAAGGGGRGMRIARTDEELRAALPLARSESLGAFGSDELILEKAIEGARHIEIQVLCDSHGNCIHLGERDCSVQRRYQKLIEESPSPAVSPELRERMGAVAVQACKAIGYAGVGTLEFLLAADGNFYFMEMNTRLQVEHGVTELLTGLDLVEWQFRVARGGALAFAQADIRWKGHAVELRLCAEDPSRQFMPQVGKVARWQPPAGARVDTALEDGIEVSPYYDSMLAKLLVWGETRQDALRQLSLACERTVLLGVRNNLAFLQRCIAHPVFTGGKATTTFLAGEDLDAPFWRIKASHHADAAAALAMTVFADDSRHGLDTLRTRFELTLDGMSELVDATPGQPQFVRIEPLAPNSYRISRHCGSSLSAALSVHDVTAGSSHRGRIAVTIAGLRRELEVAVVDPVTVWVADGAAALLYSRVTQFASVRGGPSGPVAIVAPMSGRIQSIDTSVGAVVAKGQKLATLESMKLEMSMDATCAGTVDAIEVQQGDQVAGGKLLIRITPATDTEKVAR